MGVSLLNKPFGALWAVRAGTKGVIRRDGTLLRLVAVRSERHYRVTVKIALCTLLFLESALFPVTGNNLQAEAARA
jgi:hypothetical protein